MKEKKIPEKGKRVRKKERKGTWQRAEREKKRKGTWQKEETEIVKNSARKEEWVKNMWGEKKDKRMREKRCQRKRGATKRRKRKKVSEKRKGKANREIKREIGTGDASITIMRKAQQK